MNISQLSVKRPTLVVVVFSILIILGLYSYSKLNYELMPDFSSPIITIITTYPGASPAIVESEVTEKIEDGLSTMENVKTLRSISQESVSMVMAELDFQTDIDMVIRDAERKLNMIEGELADDVSEPIVSKFSLNDFPIMLIGATSDMSPTEFYDLLDCRIKPELSRLAGVGEVSLVGGVQREIQVNLNAGKLRSYKISRLQVANAVIHSGMEFPAGNLKQSDSRISLQLSSDYKSMEELAKIAIASAPDGSLIRLEDVAEIIDTHKDIENINRINGKSSVGITIRKQADANTVEVSRRVSEAISKMENIYITVNLQFHISNNSAEFTLAAADAVMADLIYAIVLVTIVILLFLHSLRNSLIVMVSVPTSLISTFIIMQLFGYTLNLMTLMALSLVIGILVDDAIVVLENIYRHMESGESKWEAVKKGVSEITITVISTTLVLVVVFFPVALSESIITPLIAPFAMVIAISTLFSSFVSLTIIPLLMSRLAKIEKNSFGRLTEKIINSFEKIIDRFGDFVQSLLAWSLRHKISSLTIAGLMLVLSVALIPAGFVGSEFAGTGDQAEFTIQAELAKDVSFAETNRTIRKIEKLIASKPQVKQVFANIGGTSDILGIKNAQYKAELNVKLVDKEERKETSQLLANIIKKEIMAEIAGVKVRTAIPTIMGVKDESPIQIVVKSSDRDTLSKYAKVVKKLVEGVPGTNDVKLSVEGTNPTLEIEPDKEKMAGLGLSMATVGPAMRIAFSGNTDAKFRQDDHEYDINIRHDLFDRKDISDVANMTFVNNYGRPIRLNQFAGISISNSKPKLERYNRVSSIIIDSQVLGRPMGDVADDIRARLAELDLPDYVSFSYESDMKYHADAFGTLGIAFIASIISVYLIMVALYESYLYPFVVLFSIPLAIVGAILALALAGENLSLFSLLGIIMLTGIVTKNAILVVDFTNLLKKKSYPTVRAVMTAVRLRLRPILMTSLSLIIGLMPMAFASGSGAEWKNGLAWVVIGGLTSSMFLTLIIVPTIYHLADLAKEKVRRRVSGKYGAEEKEYCHVS